MRSSGRAAAVSRGDDPVAPAFDAAFAVDDVVDEDDVTPGSLRGGSGEAGLALGLAGGDMPSDMFPSESAAVSDEVSFMVVR